MEELTGNFKHFYKGLFIKGLVLYVEYKGKYVSQTDPNDPANGDEFLAYRKATPEDFAELARMGKI